MKLSHPRTLLVCACLLAATTPAGAEIWEGWHIPVADGFQRLRFGMDRATTSELLLGQGYKALHARAGTLRFERRLDGQTIELLAEFVEDARAGEGGRLCRLQLLWDRLEIPTARAMRLFESWERELERRYELPVFADEDGANALEGGRGRFVRLYQGPEMQAVLELRAVRPIQFRMLLTLDSPQLRPSLPGG
jgi:hypothetical protein